MEASAGMRKMQTLRKLPIAAPKMKAKTSKIIINNTFCRHCGLDPESSIFYNFLDTGLRRYDDFYSVSAIATLPDRGMTACVILSA